MLSELHAQYNQSHWKKFHARRVLSGMSKTLLNHAQEATILSKVPVRTKSKIRV